MVALVIGGVLIWLGAKRRNNALIVIGAVIVGLLGLSAIIPDAPERGGTFLQDLLNALKKLFGTD